MKNTTSKPAIFMYATMVVVALLSGVSFILYYSGFFKNECVYWIGIVSFMILYHFGLRILFGVITKRFKIDYNHFWFRHRSFEKRLYKFLRVRNWKDKVLTFDPASYDFKNRTLEQLATTMAKSELDHWINEGISIVSVLFAFVFGCFPAFLITAVLAMIFDAQFIVVQRYNRPIVLRLIERRSKKTAQTV